MYDKVIKTCVACNTERSIYIFHNKHTECKQCNIRRVSKRYYDNKGRILQKQRVNYARFKDLDNKLNALEESFTMKDSENNQHFRKQNLFETG